MWPKPLCSGPRRRAKAEPEESQLSQESLHTRPQLRGHQDQVQDEIRSVFWMGGLQAGAWGSEKGDLCLRSTVQALWETPISHVHLSLN